MGPSNEQSDTGPVAESRSGRRRCRGTLVNKAKELTPRTCDTVRKLADAGIYFAVTSGRPPLGMKMLVEPLNLTGPIAAFNGGMFVRPDLSMVSAHFLPRIVADRVMGLLESHHLDVWVYDDRSWYVRNRHGPHVDREESTVRFPPTVVANFDEPLERVIKIVGVSDDVELLARVEADAQQYAQAASAARSQPYYLDVTHPQANKGMVIETLSRMLKIPTGDIATIGDGLNDVLMFRKSGYSIAMGNAAPGVQKSARYVTTSNEEEGFANGIERFILRNS
jgi:Cof subfamily protein (haloacid dehalogenase superfamily)